MTTVDFSIPKNVTWLKIIANGLKQQQTKQLDFTEATQNMISNLDDYSHRRSHEEGIHRNYFRLKKPSSKVMKTNHENELS